MIWALSAWLFVSCLYSGLATGQDVPQAPQNQRTFEAEGLSLELLGCTLRSESTVCDFHLTNREGEAVEVELDASSYLYDDRGDLYVPILRTLGGSGSYSRFDRIRTVLFPNAYEKGRVAFSNILGGARFASYLAIIVSTDKSSYKALFHDVPFRAGNNR